MATALDEAGALVRLVADRLDLASSQAAMLDERYTTMERSITELRQDSMEMAHRLVATEQQCSNLMSLYVATYQLHATLDPAEVRATIAEIAISLLGAERFVLLLRDATGDISEIALAEGLDEDTSQLFANGRYVGSDPMVALTLTDGSLRIGPMEGSPVLAAVPLVVQDMSVGVLVILKMLGHRGALSTRDRDLLDLLGAHAASALCAAQVHANADRKLRTLESLVRLARPQ